MIPKHHIQKVYFLLACTLLSSGLQGMKGQEEKLSGLSAHEAQIAAWLNNASRERLRKSAINLGIRDWQDTQAQSAPRPVALQGCQIKLNDTITDVALVPYTKKVLMSAYNTLYRYDMENKCTQALAFARPIAKLLQSTDGSLCAVLLDPIEDEEPLIRFVNACKSTLELNADIEPIPYFQTDEYEVAPADISPDARYLGVISTNASACIHDLKTNRPHAIMAKLQKEFPVFSIRFLKAKNHAQNTQEQIKYVVQSNLETTLYAITKDGCTALQKIDLRPQVPGKDYFARQSAWLLPEKLIVLVGTKLFAFEATKEGAYEFKQQIGTVKKENELLQCSSNDNVLVERDCTKRKLFVRDLLANTKRTLSNPCNDRVLMDNTEHSAVIARKNELMIMAKEEQVDEATK